jgi:hypothetical protein
LRAGEQCVHECHICRKPLALYSTTERMIDAKGETVAWCHVMCAREHVIRQLRVDLEAASTAAHAQAHAVCCLIEAAGGSVRVSRAHKTAATAAENQFNVEKQADGSFLFSRKTLIHSPRGAVLPPPPQGKQD